MLDISFTLLGPIIIGFFAGSLIDKSFGLKFPIISIVSSFFGFFVGVYAVYKKYIK
ncbi:MAG: AtpZ/AtpI family protein [bacterium]